MNLISSWRPGWTWDHGSFDEQGRPDFPYFLVAELLTNLPWCWRLWQTVPCPSVSLVTCLRLSNLQLECTPNFDSSSAQLWSWICSCSSWSRLHCDVLQCTRLEGLDSVASESFYHLDSLLLDQSDLTCGLRKWRDWQGEPWLVSNAVEPSGRDSLIDLFCHRKYESQTVCVDLAHRGLLQSLKHFLQWARQKNLRSLIHYLLQSNAVMVYWLSSFSRAQKHLLTVHYRQSWH